MNLKSWWVAHPNLHRSLLIGGGAVVLFLVGYGTGRLGTPTKVVTKTEIQEKVVEHKVVDQDAVAAEVERRVAEEKTKMTRHVVTVIVRKPDGTVTENKVQDTNVQDIKESEQDLKRSDSVKLHSDDSVVKTETVTETKTVTNDRPRWSVNILGGTSFSGLKITPSGLNIKPIFGGQVQYRILGPAQIGIIGLSSGEGLLSLGVQF